MPAKFAVAALAVARDRRMDDMVHFKPHHATAARQLLRFRGLQELGTNPALAGMGSKCNGIKPYDARAPAEEDEGDPQELSILVSHEPDSRPGAQETLASATRK